MPHWPFDAVKIPAAAAAAPKIEPQVCCLAILATPWRKATCDISCASNDGATPEYIAKFKRELTQIEGTLVGREFKEFLDQHMLKLQAPR